MSIVQFDRAVILASWCEQNWGENKMPLGRGGGVNSVEWEGVTASLYLVFKGRSRNLAPSLIKSINVINSLFPGEKACQIS